MDNVPTEIHKENMDMSLELLYPLFFEDLEDWSDTC
jgi:hypothetical protein